MPWHKVKNHSDCPPGNPWAVVKDADGTVSGCHATESSANRQLAALYASEEADVTVVELGGKPNPGTQKDKRLKENQKTKKTATYAQGTSHEDGECPEGHHMMPDGKCMPDGDMAAEEETLDVDEDSTERFPVKHSPKNGRFVPAAPGSAADQQTTGTGTKRKHDKAEAEAGRVRSNYRKATRHKGGPKPWNPEAARHRLSESEVVAYNAITDEDIAQAAALGGPLQRWEGVLAVEDVETGDGREFASEALEWPDPDEVVMPLMWQERSEPQHAKSIVVGRIERIERLENGQIWGEGSIMADAPVTEQIRNGMAGGVSVDVDSVKNADVEVVFPEPDPNQVQADDSLTSLLGPPPDKIVFHRGRLRGATLVALPAFVEACIHLVDEQADNLVAAGVPVDPPREWFDDPKFDGPTPWHVDDSGRVYGHLALWSTCHTSFQDRCITPPRERDYPYFMRSELKTSTEQLVGVGPITLGTGHAALRLGARPAAEHYDNTGTAAVDVRVGEDRYGIWVAGALRPDITDVQLRELRGAALSGDWRRIGGKLRLVAILAVNVPGFPIPRMAAQLQSGNEDWSAMIAAGVVTRESAGEIRQALATLEEDGTIRVRRVQLTAIATHKTATAEGTWDSGVNEKRLPTPMPVSTARDAYAWMAPGAVTDGEVRKTDCKFIHHNVSADGAPGAANLTACSAGIGVLNGGRGGTTIPDADRQGVYNHLAGHLRDAGREPPPLT